VKIRHPAQRDEKTKKMKRDMKELRGQKQDREGKKDIWGNVPSQHRTRWIQKGRGADNKDRLKRKRKKSLQGKNWEVFPEKRKPSR